MQAINYRRGSVSSLPDAKVAARQIVIVPERASTSSIQFYRAVFCRMVSRPRLFRTLAHNFPVLFKCIVAFAFRASAPPLQVVSTSPYSISDVFVRKLILISYKKLKASYSCNTSL